MLSELHKETISKSMKKAHAEGRHPGWSHINENNNRSYPERFFKNILDSFKYYDIYEIKEHFPFGKYFLDFAIIDLKVDIEIDGQQHFRSKKAILHDFERDLFLEKNGWKIYRIAWLEIINDPENIIKEFTGWIKNMEKNSSRKYNIENVLYMRKNPPVYGNREKYSSEIKKQSDEKYRDLIMKAINSDIDFSRFGWVNDVSKLTGIRYQKVNIWIKRLFPEFYEKKCFKKASLV